MIYDLFLDDIRNPTHGVVPVITARSMDELMMTIQKHGLPRLISFDHDLTIEHYGGDYRAGATGYDAALWLANHCVQERLEFPLWRVHSMSITGAGRIKNFLLHFAPDKYNVKIQIGTNHEHPRTDERRGAPVL